jgi:sulfur carrier protein ThiS
LKVEVFLYASLARYMPNKTSGKGMVMEVSEGTTVMEHLKQMHIPMNVAKLIFLNGIHAKDDEILKDGDRLGVFPPIGGG